MFYANVFEHRSSRGETIQFNTAQSPYPVCHSDRRRADDVAAWEMGAEPHTRRIGVLRIKLKAPA